MPPRNVTWERFGHARAGVPGARVDEVYSFVGPQDNRPVCVGGAGAPLDSRG